MYRIVTKRALHETVTLMEVEAPYIAKKAKPGQFIIFRVDEDGERVPLTVAGTDPVRGTVTIIFQKVGYSTKRLDCLNEGDYILDFVGPLGVASHLDGMKKVAVVGGGLGVAIAYPQAKALHDMGAEVDVIVGPLIANTAPVAFGAAGTPITTAGNMVAGGDPGIALATAQHIAAIVGYQAPCFALVVPLIQSSTAQARMLTRVAMAT